MTVRLLPLLLCLLPIPVAAQGISDGLYAITTDGGAGTLEIVGDRGEIFIAGQGCSGGMSGTLNRAEQGMAFLEGRDGAQVCRISIEVDAAGMPGEIMEGEGCGYFHGMTCGFSGSVTGRDVPFDISAMDQGFNALAREERRSVQTVLRDRGHYRGSIDGATGPGTRLAIRAAAREDLAANPGLDLRRPSDVEAYLRSLMGASEAPEAPEAAQDEALPTEAAGASPPFAPKALDALETAWLGAWSCTDPLNGAPTQMTIDPDKISFSASDDVYRFEGIHQVSPGLVMLVTEGSPYFGLTDITETTITGYGIFGLFTCTR